MDLIYRQIRGFTENLLNDLNGIGIFIHDSEHSYHNQLFEFSIAYKHLRQNGLLICSDIN